MTTAQFDFISNATATTRQNMLSIMEPFSLEQLNKIPEGFKNNLIWNFGHVVITQQLLCYGLSGLPLSVDKELVGIYRKGGAPVGDVNQAGLDELIRLSTVLLDQFNSGYKTGNVFKNYKNYTTSYNVTLDSIEDAFQFNLAHEALHLGTMLAMRKLV